MIIIDFRDGRDPIVPFEAAERAVKSGKLLRALMPVGIIVTFDIPALKTIDDTLKGNWRVTAKFTAQNPVTVELSVERGGVYVSDFKGGTASVSAPFTLPQGVRWTQIVPYFKTSTGGLEMAAGRYNTLTKNVDMTLWHFSEYVIKINDVKYTVGAGWYDAESLDFAVQRGLIPVTNGTVDPAAAVSRADFVVAMMRTFGIQPMSNFTILQFADISHLTEEQQTYLHTAKEFGVISGMGGNRFDPDSLALREQYFQIVYNLYGAGLAVKPDVVNDKTAADFTDGASVPVWAGAVTNELILRGIIQGDDKNCLQIGAAFNNATTAVVLMRW